MQTVSTTMILRRHIPLFSLLLASFLAACGGGGGGGGGAATSPPPLAAPSALKYPAAPTFVVNTAISTLTPTVTGTVTAYSVSPAFPAGLSLDTSTGVISGTPTSVAAEANYTVRASNSAGSTTATVSIQVVAASTGAPSGLKYPNPPQFVVNTAIAPLKPTVAGIVTGYSVSPALPAGLSLDPGTGVIAGTPNSVMRQATYTVRASNSVGSVTAEVSIVVVAAATGAPSGLNYPTPPAFVVGTAITPLTPTVAGDVTGWDVNPELPAGLSINKTSGVISGTPTTVTAEATYTVRASNSVGNTTAVVSMVVEKATSGGLIITTQPTSISVPGGATATFTIAATGTGTLRYQWYSILCTGEGSGISCSTTTTAIAGATAPNLNVTSNDLNAGTYYCIVTETLANGTTASATSANAFLTATAATATAGITADNWVGPGVSGLMASVGALSDATYTWTISNGRITAGQGSPQITYTSGSLGPLQITATVTSQLAGSATGVKNVVVVATPPETSVFAQSSVLPGATGVLASTPAITGASYAWSLQNGTASATSSGSTLTDVLTYGVGTTPGSYQLSVNVTNSGGHSVSAQRSVAVVQGTFIKDVRDMAQRSLHTATLLNDGRILVAGGDAGVPTVTVLGPPYLPTVGSQSNIVGTAEVFDPVTTTWAMVGSLATARAQHTAARLNDGRVLVAGGVDVSGNPLASTEIYDPATQSWSAGPLMSVARDLPTATLLADGRVFVSGGANGNNFLGTAEIYNPITNAWSGAASMTTARVEHSATLLADGRVLAVGGLTLLGGAGTAEIYDPTANAWQSVASPPGGSGPSEGAVRLPSGQVLITDGEIYDPTTDTWFDSSPPCGKLIACLTGNDATTAILLPNGTVLTAGGGPEPEIYDPVIRAWTTTDDSALYAQSFGPAAYGTVTSLQNGQVLAEGGAIGSAGYAPSNSVSVGALFDPTQSSWSMVGSNAHAGSDAASGVLANGKVLVTGGNMAPPGSLTPLKLVDLFDPTTNTWSPAAPMLNWRAQHTATVLHGGQMLVTGGLTYNIVGPTNTAEIYDPTSNAWASAGFMTSGRYEHTASILGSGSVLVAGGNDGATCTCTTFLITADLYNPATNSFTPTGPLNTARYAHTATVLANGKVLVTGGFGGPTSTIQTGGAALASADRALRSDGGDLDRHRVDEQSSHESHGHSIGLRKGAGCRRVERHWHYGERRDIRPDERHLDGRCVDVDTTAVARRRGSRKRNGADRRGAERCEQRRHRRRDLGGIRSDVEHMVLLRGNGHRAAILRAECPRRWAHSFGWRRAERDGAAGIFPVDAG